MFSVLWDNTDKQADVVITSPSGKTYSLDNMPQAQAGEGELLFWFASAEKGTWKVKITGEGLGTVTLDSGRDARADEHCLVHGTGSGRQRDGLLEFTRQRRGLDPGNLGGAGSRQLRRKAVGVRQGESVRSVRILPVRSGVRRLLSVSQSHRQRRHFRLPLWGRPRSLAQRGMLCRS